MQADNPQFTTGPGSFDDSNPFAYVSADPVNRKDPSGNEGLVDISIANAIQNVIAGAYAGAWEGAWVAYRAVKKHESMNQAMMDVMIETVTGMVLGALYFKALGIIAGATLPTLESFSADVTDDVILEGDLEAPPGALGGESRTVPAEILADATANYDYYNQMVIDRMKAIGIPEEEIGKVQRIGEPEGAFVVRKDAVGGTQSPPGKVGVSVDTGIFLDKLKDVPGWKEASIQDRIEVIATHEYTESHTPAELYENYTDVGIINDVRHSYAIENGWKTTLSISENARAILKAEAIKEGYLDE